MFKWQKKNTTESVSIQENTEVFIDDFKQIVKSGNEVAKTNLIKFMANSVQGELLSKCFYNDRNYAEFMRYVTHSLILDLPYEEYRKCKIKLSIARTPLISCVWNHTRMVDGLTHIGASNDNPFDGISHSGNIQATLINPLGLVIVEGGNHSVNAAIIQNEGEIIVTTVVDISSVLEKYKFDGKVYREIETNMKINSRFLKNGAEPLTYTLGLFFEMSKIIAKHKKY